MVIVVAWNMFIIDHISLIDAEINIEVTGKHKNLPAQ
jgi:hypothetical protein